MLFFSRKAGESILIQPRPDLDPTTLVMELFARAPIELRVTSTKSDRVQLGIAAHPGLNVVREELMPAKVTDFLAPDAHLLLALKIRILMRRHNHTHQSLAEAARLPLDTVVRAERGDGLDRFTDLELLAATLKVTTLEFLRPPGYTAEEREIMAELEPVT